MPGRIEVQSSPPQLQDPYSFSLEQEVSLFAYGYLESFTFLFYEEETAGGGYQTVRLETWDDYTQGIGLTFINGELTAENPIDSAGIGDLEPLPYYPEQFSVFMSLEEVISAAGIDNYIEIPLKKEFLEGGAVYYVNSLTFGLKENQLLYSEALALAAE